MAKTPDEMVSVRPIMGVLGRMPPKLHSEMKLGKRKASRSKSPSTRKRKSQAKKAD